jgi:hypothetical protein
MSTMVTFRINAPAGDFAKLVEEFTGRLAFIRTFEYTNSSVTLQRATQERKWNGLDRVAIRGISSGTMYRNAEGKLTARADGEAVHVVFDYGRDYIVFDLTPIGSRTRIDAHCHVDGSVRLYFYELLIEIGKDFPEAKDEIYAYLRTIFPPSDDAATDGPKESKADSGGGSPLETTPAIRVPKRTADLSRWKSVWLKIKYDVQQKGLTVAEILAKRDKYPSVKMPRDRETITAIIAAGQAGLLD